ncbi:hypothetical protein [Bizionia paragorgiae]|uniref:hypothetical protein n=1 Tax=Bizionia paragorgiae TaxID=283786 RepID=UPI003A8F774E
MKTKYVNKHMLILAIYLLIASPAFAQVGIGTTTPKGQLDLSTTTMGLVYPKIALTATNVESPVINPNGGALEPGTVVYNTSLTQTGTYDVTPGLYVWDGSKWAPQFIREEYKRFEQNNGIAPYACQRVPFGFNGAVNGLGPGENSFSPKYSGFYKIKVSTSFGGGEFTNIKSSTGNELSTGTAEGNFYFNLSGPGVDIDDINGGRVYTHSYSTYNRNNTPVQKYDTVTLDSYIVFIRVLRAGGTYDFNLRLDCFDVGAGSGFVNNGTSGNGLHHVGHDIPCSVEFTYLGTNE